MKIVGWNEFSKMPPGTIFQSIAPYSTGELEVLGAILSYQGEASDIVSAPLLPTACPAVNLSLSREEEQRYGVTENDAVLVTPTGFGRSYGRNGGARWLVWEQADQERLAGWLLDPEKACAQTNDDPHVLLKVEEARP